MDTTKKVIDLNGEVVKYKEDEDLTVGTVVRLALNQYADDKGGVYKIFQLMETLNSKKPSINKTDLEIMEKAVEGFNGLGNYVKGQVIEVIKESK